MTIEQRVHAAFVGRRGFRIMDVAKVLGCNRIKAENCIHRMRMKGLAWHVEGGWQLSDRAPTNLKHRQQPPFGAGTFLLEQYWPLPQSTRIGL
jgi:hypothetical protein